MVGTNDDSGDSAAIDRDGTLAGGGDLGARMRATDWAATPLGPVEHWPRALKTCVRLLLTSRQPMWLGWGDALTYLYNDPYKAIVGGKHPWALGRPTAEVWREIWGDIAPRIRAALTGEEGTYDEALLLIMERHGYPEETYYTFSYSPVPDDTGRVCGIFCANSDDTRRIIGERQLALLRELAASTAEARTIVDACALSVRSLETNPRDLPFALLYLIGADGEHATLAGTAGIASGHAAAPATISLVEPAIWPIAEVFRTSEAQQVTALPASLGRLPAGAWDRSPTQAVALPIPPSGETGQSGVLVVGLNPYRLYDDDYARFLGLVAVQIAAAIGNAWAYQEERRRAEALAELDRAKTAFFANVSHEFRTPLTLLLGPLEDAIGAERDPIQRGSLETAHRNGLRLLRMVNSLLDFSRIEAGRVRASFAPTDLPTLTADLASTFRSAVERAHLRLAVETPPFPAGLTTYVDREMWEQIVLNLLSNAFKFTFTGGITVALRPAADRRAVTLAVRDTGTGIPERELPLLFERFHRVQGAQARTHEGSGIGLALVQELVRLHGGTIAVASVEGRGTTFTVTIPTGRAHLPPDQVWSGRDSARAATGAAAFVGEALRWLPDADGGLPEYDVTGHDALAGASPEPEVSVAGGRVLLADDNADMRDYVARLLRGRYAVEVVGDGAAALSAALAQPPDLVLSDVMMPHLDGFGLLRALRADPRTREVPVLLLSARAGEEARVEGLDAGADDYLIKPFSARELLARVGSHLALSRARTEATRREQAARLEAERGRARLRTLFEHAPAAICLLSGPDHLFTLANPRYLELIARDDVLGMPLRDVLPEVVDQGVIELLDTVYRTGQAFVGDELLVGLDRDRDGAIEDCYFNFVYAPFFGVDGAIEGIFVHANEVTTQVRSRQRLEIEVAARERTQSLLTRERAVLELIARGALLSETLTALARAIEAQADHVRCSILLVDRDQMRLRHGAAPSLPDAYNQAIDGIAIGPRAGSCGTAAYRRVPVIVADIAADPLWTDFRDLAAAYGLGACWSTPILTPSGQVLGTFAVYYRDPREPSAPERELVATLTYLAGIAIERHWTEVERERLLEAERAARTEAEEAVYARDTFLSIAAHELRTPVTSLKGAAQLLQRRQSRGRLDAAQLAQGLRSLDRSADRLASLTDDLLDVARIRTGQLPLDRHSLDLVALTGEAVAAARDRLDGRHRLTFDAPGDAPRVLADAGRIEQVLTNLLDNAIKYSPAGGEIAVTAHTEGAGMRVTVRDEGIGLPSGATETIFAPFGRAANAAASSLPGMGLGLYICRNIIERHGGWIRAESDGEDRGTSVTLWLPHAPVEASGGAIRG